MEVTQHSSRSSAPDTRYSHVDISGPKQSKLDHNGENDNNKNDDMFASDLGRTLPKRQHLY